MSAVLKTAPLQDNEAPVLPNKSSGVIKEFTAFNFTMRMSPLVQGELIAGERVNTGPCAVVVAVEAVMVPEP
jgi:hypothetical protein